MCTLFTACGDNENEDALQLSINECTLSTDNPYVAVSVTKSDGDCKVQSSNEEVAVAEVIEGKIYIWGFHNGDAMITVTDAANNKATIKVIVNGEVLRPVLDMEMIFVKKGETRRFMYEYADCPLTVEDEGIVSGYVEGSRLVIKGEKIGKTILYALKNMWPAHGYEVNVVDKYPLMAGTNIRTIEVGKEIEVLITMGNGGYSVESSEPSVATANIADYTGDERNILSNPAQVKIKGISSGKAVITVTDSEGLTKSLQEFTVYP